jgi:hypothetical protein
MRREALEAMGKEVVYKTDPLGHVYMSTTTEESTASFEWFYWVSKRGQEVLGLAEMGVDSKELWDHWINEEFYEAGMFFGKLSTAIVNQLIELWNTYFAQFLEDPEAAQLKSLGSKYGPS